MVSDFPIRAAIQEFAGANSRPVCSTNLAVRLLQSERIGATGQGSKPQPHLIGKKFGRLLKD